WRSEVGGLCQRRFCPVVCGLCKLSGQSRGSRRQVALLKLPAGHRLIHFERIDSTNAEARRLAESGERGPLWIWSDEQTGGRGRLGRTWVSEPGNLYVTCLFQTAAAVAAVAQVSFVAAIAVHELASDLLPKEKLFLKWPNDVLLDGAKF